MNLFPSLFPSCNAYVVPTDFSYLICLPVSSYRLRLYFKELIYHPAGKKNIDFVHMYYLYMHLIKSISFNLFSMPWNFKWEISIIMITYICVLMIFFLELINLFFCHPFHIPIIHPVVSHFIWLSLTSRIKSRILNAVYILLSAPYTYERPHDIFQSTKNKGPLPIVNVFSEQLFNNFKLY